MNKCKGYSKMWFLLLLLVAFVAGCAPNDTVPLNSDKAITAYSFGGFTGTVNETAKTIAVTMPYGTDVTALVATFTTTGTGVKVGAVAQVSGTTPNDFTSPVAYKVTAADSTTATYTVTVTVALSSDKAITSYSLASVVGTINETAKTISVTMPYGSSVTALVATFTSTGTGVVKVGAVDQLTGATPNDFTNPVSYIVTAADGTTATYTVTVTVAANSAKALGPYSLDGVVGTVNETAKTISVTMPFGTDVTDLIATFTTTGQGVKIGAVAQTSGTTVNDFTTAKAYIVTAADGTTATYTVTVTVVLNSAKALGPYSLNGVQGAVNETAKTIAVTLPFGTNPNGLIATFTTTGQGVKIGAVAQTSGTTANDFTTPKAYIVTAADLTTATYTVTVTVAANSAKAIAPYTLAGVSGIINETAKTISVTMPFGTNVTALIATFTSTGTGPVTIGGVSQVSGTTPNDFTSSKAYLVTAADGSTATYTVTVTVAANSAKAIAPYTLAGVSGIINETAKTISVTMPFGTNPNGLIATFTTTGQGVKIGLVTQTSGTTANDFTNPVSYIVTAADTTTATYTVTVTVALNSAKALGPYSLDGVVGAVNETTKTIAVTMPFGTNPNGLIATFTTTGTGVKIGLVTQTSGTTANDFTNPVSYIVTAADTTTATYTVTVTMTALNLKRTASFAVLSTGSSITATGITAVTGDVGAISFTGGGTLNITAGTDYSGGSGQPFLDAVADLPSVISDANSAILFPCGASISGVLTGVALTPGVTCISSDAAILNTGVVTLNGAGVYIIRTAGALTPAATSSVAFGGTASDANTTVFWVVGSADLGTPSTWMGTILSGGAITLGDTDTLVKGRVLTTAAVTLSNNIITIP